MRKTLLIFVFTALSLAMWPSVKIPPTRVRILYDTQNPGVSVYSPRDPASEVPAECVEVTIQAWGKIPRSERKKPRRFGEDKWRKTVDWYFYVETPDGWLTIPEVSDVPIDNFEIWITPPAGGIAKCDCAVDDKRILPISPGIFQCSLNERTFSKFVALPEEKRILLAKLVRQEFQGGVVSFPHKYNYAEALWVLQWCELNMRYWPLLIDSLDTRDTHPKDPLYKEQYFSYVRHCLYYIQESLVGMPMPDWESAKGWKPMTDEEKKNLKARLSAMICKDLKEKKEAWKVPVMMIPKEVVSEPLFSEVHCDDLEWQEGKFDN